jgi:glycogen(starch) synthase
MDVLMLGWEFPPYITGGLGTACHGLTRAMDRRGLNVTFVVPKAVGRHEAQHVNIVGPDVVKLPPQIRAAILDPRRGPIESDPTSIDQATDELIAEFTRTRFIEIDAGFTQPYSSVQADKPVAEITEAERKRIEARQRPRIPGQFLPDELPEDDAHDPHWMEASTGGSDYGGDMFAQVERYARFVLAATRHANFDVIHAHDWMTYPAGLAIARHTGKPLVVHVHSTEFDRSGEHVNQPIYDIERRGMHAASRVVAVSQLTRDIVVRRYGVPQSHVQVVYNGVDLNPTQRDPSKGIRSRDKIVLYFGRITMQKGPEYFIQAAKRVLDVMDNVKFVVAGSGDMAQHMIEMAAHMGIGHKVLFTGFLRGDDIRRVFSLADLYVMPSVSEPFGIAPLEAMSHDVPALISKSSGVSEVLTHALKVDFWDTEDMANKIIAVLRHPPLSQTLREHGTFEVRRITWDGAAQKCEKVYRDVIAEMYAPPSLKA